MFLALVVVVTATLLDFCVIGDSTLQMFITPAWRESCSKKPGAACGFSIVSEGVYYKQMYRGKLYNRSTFIGRSTDGVCTFMVADYHTTTWGTDLRNFWTSSHDTIQCRRLMTNHHHHADTSFLATQQTFETIKTFAVGLQVQINATLPFEQFVYILPTFPRDAVSRFPQSRIGVLETSSTMSTLVETIATLQDLSEIWRERGRYTDNMHFDSSVMLHNLTRQIVESMLAREFDICRRKRSNEQ